MGLGPTRDLGPAIVAWGANDIDEIFDEMRWKLEGQSEKVFEMLYGATAVDEVFLGYSACEITIPATRITLALLATLLPGGTNSGGASGFVGVKGGASGAGIGDSMYDNSYPLIIKPIQNGIAAVNGKWLRLEHAYPVPNFDVTFNLRDQRVYGLTFKAFPDATSKLLWSAGKVATGTSY